MSTAAAVCEAAHRESQKVSEPFVVAVPHSQHRARPTRTRHPHRRPRPTTTPSDQITRQRHPPSGRRLSYTSPTRIRRRVSAHRTPRSHGGERGGGEPERTVSGFGCPLRGGGVRWSQTKPAYYDRPKSEPALCRSVSRSPRLKRG